MIIKKYKALTEKEAILLAKEDLGPDAIVMNVKKIKPGGIMRLFKKSRVELTAAIDDDMESKLFTIFTFPLMTHQLPLPPSYRHPLQG